jgi:phosphotriesterase-related protein
MAKNIENRPGKVMTVEGLVSKEEMGITLPHEHIMVHGWDHRERNYFNSASMELIKYPKLGGTTIVELTNIGRDRDPLFLKKIASKTGIKVIMGTGFYRDAWLSPEVHDMPVDELSQVMVRDIVNGVGDTGVCAGVIGEIGVSDPITPTEEKILAASAKSQNKTGVAINVHFEIGLQEKGYNHVIDILESEGADIKRVVISHLIPRPDNFELYKTLADRGCYLEFDLFGQESWPLMIELINTDPDVQIASIKGFIDNGLFHKILISQNVNHILHMTVNGGFGYILWSDYDYKQEIQQISSACLMKVVYTRFCSRMMYTLSYP